MKAYLKYYFSILFIVFTILSIPIFYLYSAGEYLRLDTIVEKQIASTKKILYGTALHQNIYDYKSHLVSLVHPKIIALGSSRVMQFREHMFPQAFLNLGGSMNNINDGHEFVSKVIHAKPDIVIIGADVAWFNENFQDPEETRSHVESKILPNIRDSLLVIEWLIEGKITVDKIAKTLRGKTGDDIGVAGMDKDGFGPDGSYYYTRRITEEKYAEKKNLQKFNDIHSNIINKESGFQYASSANDQHIANFTKLIEKLEENGIHTIVFLTPFASAINSHMRSLEGKYAYINDLKSKFNKNGVVYYDYTDATTIGSEDCEFVDGLHGGEVTYMRILKDIAQNDPVLYKYLNNEHINASIEKNRGKAFVPDNEITEKKEIDFLELGCVK